LRVEFCTGCHARSGGEASFPGNSPVESFARLVEALERHLGVGYFGGFSPGYRLEVDFVPCLDHCNQGYAVSIGGEILVMPDEESLLALVDRLSQVQSER
jgi:NADH:ubiquinone oxidoreductase subunit E